MQKLWQKNVEWDEPLEKSIQDEWLAVANYFQDATALSIARRYFTTKNFTDVNQLHVFADASPKAYGAVAYLRSIDHTAFVMAKTRVAPLKELTLPKLELMAALIATRVSKYITTSLQTQNTSVNLWTNSQIVLYWIKGDKKTPTFVSHRVKEIHQLAPNATWRYCPTDDNPADLFTRGITSQFLKSSTLWSHGPTWLTTDNHWPKWEPSSSLHLAAATATGAETSPAEHTRENKGLHCIITLTDYSTLNKLIAVIANL